MPLEAVAVRLPSQLADGEAAWETWLVHAVHAGCGRSARVVAEMRERWPDAELHISL